MQCPNCGKIDNRVIDSRPSKEGVVIRRRRQCLICATRFTTYEAAEEQLLPFLIGEKTQHSSPVRNLKAMLSFMPAALGAVSKQTKKLINRIERYEKTQAVKESKKRARERKLARRKAKSLMMIEAVFKIVKRHKKGVDISKLKDKTGFDAKKINSIVFNLRKEGRIKSLCRGFYVRA